VTLEMPSHVLFCREADCKRSALFGAAEVLSTHSGLSREVEWEKGVAVPSKSILRGRV
jgi:hypothetical protein